MAVGPCSVPSRLLFAVKPDTPQLSPDVDFSEEMPLEATVEWAPPLWPPHMVLICQFRYKKCQSEKWTQVSTRLPSYSVSSRWDGTPNPREHRLIWHLFVMESPQILHGRPHKQLCPFVFSDRVCLVARLASAMVLQLWPAS